MARTGGKRRMKEPEVRALVERERRLGFIGGGAAVLSLCCSIAAVPIAASGTGGGRIQSSGTDRDLLLDVSDVGSGQTVAMLLRVAGLLLLIALAWYLYVVTVSRRPETPKWVPLAGGLAFVLLAANTVVGFTEVKDVARAYVGSGPQSVDRAHDLLEDNGLLRGTPITIARMGMNALLGLWLAMVNLDTMRTGLLTRFLVYFGFAAAAGTGIGFPAADALLYGWLGSVGILALGYWPGGRPPAWAEGRAVTWEEEEGRAVRARRGRSPS